MQKMPGHTTRLGGMITGLLLLLTGCDSSQLSSLQKDINHIASHWAPDRREGICNVAVARGRGGSVILTGETMDVEAKTEIINLAKTCGIPIVDSIRILPDTSGGNGGWGLITLSVANIRKQPEHEAEMTSQAVLGTPVRVLKIKNGWLLIQTPDHYLGYTEEASVERMNEAALSKWRQSERIIYTDNTGWIYTKTGNEVVGDIVAGSVLETTAETASFYEIVLPDGRTGVIPRTQAVGFKEWKSSVNPTGLSVCQTAASVSGIPYLWGGASPKAADCSGFVQSVYFRNGIILRRDASLQLHQGQEIDIVHWERTFREGDLLFFGSKQGTLHATHVAIYLGNSEFIHASGRVMVSSLDANRSNFDVGRKETLVAARRILNTTGNKVLTVAEHPWY